MVPSFPSARLIKICGLSTPVTLEAALRAGADMIGLVFFPKSPRHVALDKAAHLAGLARGRAKIVALVVDADDALLDAITQEVAPEWLQLHGKETPERVVALRARTGCLVMKAAGIATHAEVTEAATRFSGVADQLLFDAKPPPAALLPGGNGLTFDWSVLSGLDLPIPFMLSGGLTVANVAEAMRVPGSAGVDVSSGVETAPGVKDPGLIEAFVAAARGSSENANG